MKTFKYRKGEDALYCGDEAVPTDDSGDYVAPLEVVADASLASLRSALGSSNPDPTDPLGSGLDFRSLPAAQHELYVSPAPPDEFSVDYSERLPSNIAVLRDGSTAIDVEVALHGVGLEEEDVPPLLAPMLKGSGASVTDVALHGEGTQLLAVLRLRYQRRGATIKEALDLGGRVEAMLATLRDGELKAESALALLVAGRGSLLVGLPESHWLEVKTQGYDLDEDAGRIELAQDVARFANGTVAGLLVIGYRTKKRGGDDLIVKMTPSPTRFDATRYHRAIDAKVFPPMVDLDVREIPVPLSAGNTGYLLAIHVPAQPEESKPVLVHGAIVGGKTEGAFISIVQRRGEHSVPVTAQMVHATLAAGRALLRRGELPVPRQRPPED